MPEVETCHGRIQGTESAGIRSFRGVPFASPPVGRRRFLPPVAPEPWTGAREATRPGPAAPQYALPFLGWISAAGVGPGDDCLSVNVWTPGLDGARRPVLVWIHGGGFMVGAGSTPIYDGSELARRGDVVVVTLNYRLGALGYVHLKHALGAGFEESSNLGVRDQIAGLEWVRDNIERFGGDPGNVTVFGQSAGGMSIGALLGAPRARQLFQRAICQSGATDHVLDADFSARVARTFIERLGGPPPTHEALGAIPIESILLAQRETMAELSNMETMMVFLPTVDDDVIPAQPLGQVRRGETAHIPLMVGATLDEWRLFRLVDPGPRGLREADLVSRFGEALGRLYPSAPDAETAVRDYRAALETRGRRRSNGEVWSDFQSARIMHYPASRLAEAQAAAGGSAYAYLFTWRPPAVRRALGACHGLDIPFVFGSIKHPLARPLAGFTASAARLSLKMQHAWIRFARHGDPGHERLPAWDAYEPQRRATMVLGRTPALAGAPLEPERALLGDWRGEAPSARRSRQVG
ncbi:MAG: carboxylesterase family protein [Myxococcota bacterium]|nr:carboxylesterase family protein [Myxococcota bacterium]